MKALTAIISSVIIGCAGAVYAVDEGAARVSTPHFAVRDHFRGPDGGWDYATVDTRTRHLFLGRSAGVLSLDLKTQQITPVFVRGAGVHGAFPAGNTGLVVSTNGDSDTVTIFEDATGMVLAKLPVGMDPDGAVYEPMTGLVAVMNHAGGTVSLVDVHKRKVVGSINVGGKLEFPAASTDGRVFVTISDKREIAVLDVPSRKITKKFILAECVEPTGLAYYAVKHWLISVCGNGVTKIIRADDGREVASLKTGLGSDGVILDAAHGRAFIPAGRDGTLTLIDLNADKPAILQVVATHKGARLGALDRDTGRVYLPAAQFGPPVPPSPWPSVTAGTFEFLVVESR